MEKSSIEQLNEFIQNPENCFDYYLIEHQHLLNNLSVIQLKFLVEARCHCCKLNSIHRFNRDELEFCIKEGVAEPNGLFSKVCNEFIIADTFFGE